MNKLFSIEISSDLDYEDIVADIYYLDFIVAKVIQEKGINNMELVMFNHIFNDNDFFVLPFDDFIEVLQKAKSILLQKQKLS